MRRSATSRSRSSGRSSSGAGSTTTLTAPDLAPEKLVVADGLPALFAVDDRDRREAGIAAGAAAEHDAAALRALVRHFRLELLEPALRGTAGEAEGDPVAKDLPALLPEPVGS